MVGYFYNPAFQVSQALKLLHSKNLVYLISSIFLTLIFFFFQSYWR